jgi:GTP cyclohydrolase I
MTTRGVHKAETSTVTSQMRGIFRSNPASRAELLQLVGQPVG